jgi:uroporphyrinogen decarboxylase
MTGDKMDSYSRFLAALRGEPVDRVPASSWLGMPLMLSIFPEIRGYTRLFERMIEDPVKYVIEVQEAFGMDPIVLSQSEHPGEVITYPSLLFTWPDEALANWQESRNVLGSEGSHQVVQRSIRTPRGALSLTYRLDDHSRSTFEHMLKNENDLDALAYWPDPSLLNIDRLSRMVRLVNKRGVFHHVAPGVWDEACQLRGINTLSLDLFDRPAWVHRLMRMIADRQIRLFRRLAQSGIETINYNETWVGFGISPASYREFILPYDREVVQVIHDAGMLVSYHNCGRARRLLELHADTGADALETLTPAGRSGDVDLADAKARIGDRITLFGGFNEHVLYQGDASDVEAEVHRCMDAAAKGGRYIMRATGQIMAATPGNLEAMTAAVRKFGAY